ncbi:hypothetical protein P5G63_11715 [Aeromonas salmonicida]|uniref:capsular polysaccharide export protein, LipB/KpsS family n=1 Tax=Aeromonas salmonicida TaxID=645 RepID=UPI00224060F0|nr:hypothetical protein [Aeromonas salmonicida]MDF8329124.1 hypothetical protein [Aeromonas salmonicida]
MMLEIVGREGAKSLSIATLPSSGYLLAGLGNYSQLILQRLQERQCQPPFALVDTMSSGCTEKFGLPVINMAQASQQNLSIIIGSSPYDYEQEVIAKLKLEGGHKLVALDPEEILAPLADPCTDLPVEHDSMAVVLLVCMLDIHVQKLSSLITWFHQRHIVCRIVRPYDVRAIAAITPTRLLGAIIWNGVPAYYDSVKQYLLELDKPLLYAELGFFPQRDHVYLDYQGVNLARDMELLTSHQEAAERELNLLRERLLEGRRWIPSETILVPLQIATDTNVRLYSDYGDRMQRFIDDVIRDYGNERLIFKPHPLDPLQDTYNYHGYEVVSGDFMTLALSSKLICGINSSTLFEARVVGIPVHFYGNSLLNNGENEHMTLLKMVNNQFRVDGADLERKIDKFMRYFGL